MAAGFQGRVWATVYAYRTGSPSPDDHRRGDSGVVGQGEVDVPDPEGPGAVLDRADDHEERSTAGVGLHLRIVPRHPRGRAERLGQGLLAAKRAASDATERLGLPAA